MAFAHVCPHLEPCLRHIYYSDKSNDWDERVDEEKSYSETEQSKRIIKAYEKY
jgi:hypothetical protein